ncbi:MAG: diacylglycerol kinase [Gammaproteobacteria bacterium]|jgi:diacylglycerol kinase (ATP)|nr:diacylglycerol kinase [Gammaproteobacteria bacterium]
MKPGKTGISRIVDATLYSCRGFRAAFRHESAFRQELGLALVALPLAWLIAQDAVQFLLLALPLLLILLVELANSAIEAIVDRIGSEQHELSGRAKDMGSAMVFVSLTIAAVSWLAILGDRYFR